MTEETKWWEIAIEDSGDDWWDTTTYHHSTWWELDTHTESDWWELTQHTEEGEWVEGVAKSLPIEWYHILDWIPVADDREIVNVTVEPHTVSHLGGGHYDALSLKGNLEFLKLYGAERVDICLEETADQIEIPLFGAHEDSMLKAVYIVPEGNAVGDNTDYMKLIVRNKLTGGDACTKTYVAGNNINTWKLDLMGPIHKTHGLIPYGESTSLIVEKHGVGFTFPRSVIIVLWDYATDRDFEEADL